MAKINAHPSFRLGDLRSKGNVATHLTKYGPHIQAWPRPRGRARSGYDLYRQIEFGIAAQLAAHPFPLDLIMAQRVTKDTTEVPRDWLMRCAMGTGIRITLEDGTELVPARMVTNNPLYWLDLITDLPGSVLYRANIGWIGLLPGETGQVLTFIDHDHIVWADPAGSGGGSPDYDPPNASQFTTLVNAIALTQAQLGLGMTGPADAGKLYAALKPFTPADKTIIARVQTSNYQYNYHGVGLVFGNSATNKYLMHGLHTLAAGDDWTHLFEGGLWNSPTSFNAGSGGGLRTQSTAGWLRIDYDAASHTLAMAASLDGINWRAITSNSTWLGTPDVYGVAVDARSTSGPVAGAITAWSET